MPCTALGFRRIPPIHDFAFLWYSIYNPGFRFTLFVQGCGHNCPGCHNPQTHDYAGGRECSAEEVIKAMLSNPLTDGLTLSGGEPFDQAESCFKIARAAKNAGLNVWAYSGYTFEQLLEKGKSDVHVKDLLSILDILVDGPFLLDQRSLALNWRGSKNQRIIDVPQSLSSGSAVISAKFT